MPTRRLIFWPRWTVDLEEDAVRLCSPDGAQFLGHIERGKVGREFWEEINGTARLNDMPHAEGWSAEIGGYRGVKERRFLTFRKNDGQEIVLDFRKQLPDSVTEESINDQLSGENRMGDKEHARQQDAVDAHARQSPSSDRGGTFRHHGGVHGGQESRGVQPQHSERHPFRRQ